MPDHNDYKWAGILPCCWRFINYGGGQNVGDDLILGCRSKNAQARSPRVCLIFDVRAFGKQGEFPGFLDDFWAPPPKTRTISVDELGPLSAKTYPGDGWVLRKVASYL